MASEYVAAKTSVWWDIEDCKVPKNFDPNSVPVIIKNALFKLGYIGPVSIFAYGGDTSNIPESVIPLKHIPSSSGEDDNNNINGLVAHLISWAVANPAPANIMLISGKKSALSDVALPYLGEMRYNILLSASLPAAAIASAVWNWTTLLAGGSPIGSGGGEKEEEEEEDPLAEYKGKDVETVVWWHVQDCKIPPYLDIRSLAKNITTNIKSALSNLGYQGPVSSIFAYFTGPSPNDLHRAFFFEGINLWHSSPSKVETNLVGAMFDWTMRNAAPANIMLISGDGIFREPLRLMSRRYNILLSASLPAAAKTVWDWDTLLAGGSPIESSCENTRQDAECLASKTASLPCNDPIGSSGDEGSSRMLNVSSTVSQSGVVAGPGDGDDVKAKKLRNRRAKLRAKLRRSREIHEEVKVTGKME